MNRKMTVLHVEGAWDIPVRACIWAIGALTFCVIAISLISRMRLCAKFKKKYEQKYREKLLKHKCRGIRLAKGN